MSQPMWTRATGTVVYVAGSMTPVVVMERDQWRDHQSTRKRMVKLRPQSEPDTPGRWYLSNTVTTGDGADGVKR